MFVNLLAAHALRFKLTWKRSGIFILHGGVLLLFVGEFITREFQVEQQMRIPEGGSANFTVDTRNHELAFITRLDAETDRVTVIPGRQLRDAAHDGSRISHPDLPVDILASSYMPNSDLVSPRDKRAGDNPATAGEGMGAVAIPLPEVSGADTGNKMDLPSLYVRLLKKGTDEAIGTYLVSVMLIEPQTVKVGDQEFGIAFRNTRYYKPFSLKLVDFRFDRYVGTDTAKNYSSDILLTDPEKEQYDRPVVIKMNEPFLHRGETFYQSSFTQDEKGTILQVVRNPGRWHKWVSVDYIACAMVGLGMLIHFGIGILGFLTRARRTPVAAPTPSAVARPPLTWRSAFIPAAVMGCAGLYLLGATWPRTPSGGIDLRDVGRLAVVDGGRVKPLDTVARVDLRLINHAEEYEDTNGVKQPAIRWLMEVASNESVSNRSARDLKVFRIEHEQVRDLLKLERREGLRYSLSEIGPRYGAFLQAEAKAARVPAKERDLFQVKVLELSHHLQIFLKIAHGRNPLVLPPDGSREWESPAEVSEEFILKTMAGSHGVEDLPKGYLSRLRAQIEEIEDPQQREASIARFDEMVLEGRVKAAEKNPALRAWDELLSAFRAARNTGDVQRLKAAVAAFRAETESQISPEDRARVRFEAFLNEAGLFYHCTIMYVLAMLAGLGTWVALVANPPVGQTVRRVTYWWLVATFLVHTFTLLSRMYLMDRPLVFVTNLYSSAVFIGWGVVGVCLVIERLYPIGVGNFVGAVLGFATTIIAHNLATSGDTLEMMQAVLDTNFWLATHVTMVTLGYSATYIAGAVGLVYLGLYVLPPEAGLKKAVTIGGAGAKPMELGRVLGQIIYGVVCFATLLSFIGTVLGGIWADQSWGRFWGWDPKENGAVLIVLWNALILHARWCGLVKDRGMALLAIFGNAITTWSWFGTNQLGVGLHAYGFSNKLAFGCAVTWVLHVGFIVVGLIPWPRIWNTSPTATTARGG
jgi:ABC-type transport system involved in cytochrome c biogenesis permease subunit